MRAVAGILAGYAAAGAAGLALYVLSFQLPLGGEVLFYRGLLLAVLVAAVLTAGLIAMRRRLALQPATLIGAVLSSLSLNVCFLVLFPVTIDRSISVFLLSRIEAEQPLSSAELRQVFADEYIGAMRQIPRRVHEQEISGNIAVDAEGRITLTPRGERFNALAREASGWFGTDPRFVHAGAPEVPEKRPLRVDR